MSLDRTHRAMLLEAVENLGHARELLDQLRKVTVAVEGEGGAVAHLRTEADSAIAEAAAYVRQVVKSQDEESK